MYISLLNSFANDGRAYFALLHLLLLVPGSHTPLKMSSRAVFSSQGEGQGPGSSQLILEATQRETPLPFQLILGARSLQMSELYMPSAQFKLFSLKFCWSGKSKFLVSPSISLYLFHFISSGFSRYLLLGFTHSVNVSLNMLCAGQARF